MQRKSIVENQDASIYSIYFQYTREHIEKYGEKTIVLLQVGAFFEIYGLKDPNTGEISESHIAELSNICNLHISDKKMTYNNKNVVMAGFRDFTLDKYILLLTENNFTIPVFVQEKNGKIVSRKLDAIYSNGTYLPCNDNGSQKISNYIMCIWMEKYKPIKKTPIITRDTIVYGVSVINIMTGKSNIFQYETTFYMNTTTFDELERYVSIFSPCQVIIISPFDDNEINTIIQFCGIHTMNIQKINVLSPSADKLDKIKNGSNQKYIRHILSDYFGNETYDVCSEFQSLNIATQSFCYLLNFIKEHNPDLVRRIALPEFNNTSNRLILANHTLLQLNIIDDSNNGKQCGQLSSVMNFLNKCCSPMGRRLFQYQITNPTFDEEWLNNEYRFIGRVLDIINKEQLELNDMFRKYMIKMKDIEKISRQIIIRKIFPSSVYDLYQSVLNIQEINNSIVEYPDICNYLCSEFLNDNMNETANTYIGRTCNSILQFFNTHFIIDKCKGVFSMNTFDENIIQDGFSQSLDDSIRKYKENQELFYTIRNYLNQIMRKYEKTDENMDYVKIHETEKSGVCLQITTKRSQLLRTILEKEKDESNYISFDKKTNVLYTDIKFTKSSSTNVDIEFTILNDICKSLLYSKERIQSIISTVYLEILELIENNFINDFEKLAKYIAKLDVLQSKVYVAKKYNYCSPIIQNNNGLDPSKSFVDVVGLRHCLIEHIQQNEIYVANDICLGKNDNIDAAEKETENEIQDGILLYGTNAVGKTSFIRALGISIIMAQSGMYVPCSRFVYKPYTAIFSRILGNDNIFKGLSTFAVEMSELRIILKLADDKSMILGDELCSGTEMESALSIFVSGLMRLHEKKSSFIFATHFHEIVDYDEIKDMKNLKMKHMEVVFDREKDCLIYDRRLKNGSGPRIYGLEVCRSMYLEDEFIECAYAIRNKYYPETKGHYSNTKTVYNSHKIRGICEMCHEKIGNEIHHLQEQQNANEDGFIGTFHKNHVANLMSICNTCHDKIHSKDNVDKNKVEKIKKPVVRRKTTNGYMVI